MFPEIFRDDVFRIETQRLWLRWPTARDEAAIERSLADPAVAEMTAEIPHPYPKGGAASFIYAARVGNAQGSGLTFALTFRARPHEVIGMVSLRDQEGVATLGYWLARPHWNRGLMSEAVGALLHAVFQLSHVERIETAVRLDNAHSRSVLEACGFVQTGEQEVDFPARGRAFRCAAYIRTRENRASREVVDEPRAQAVPLPRG